MKVNQNTDYAFRVLIYLGTTEKLVKISAIAEIFSISFNHLTKTVHQLVLLGFVKSKQGKNGGITLALHPEKINLRKVVEAMENNLAVVECLGPNNTCIITSSCLLKGVMRNATNAFLNELENYNLNDVIQNKKSTLRNILKIVN